MADKGFNAHCTSTVCRNRLVWHASLRSPTPVQGLPLHRQVFAVWNVVKPFPWSSHAEQIRRRFLLRDSIVDLDLENLPDFQGGSSHCPDFLGGCYHASLDEQAAWKICSWLAWSFMAFTAITQRRMDLWYPGEMTGASALVLSRDLWLLFALLNFFVFFFDYVNDLLDSSNQLPFIIISCFWNIFAEIVIMQRQRRAT